jgi:putative flavoprotein involved in K+ transport
VPYETATEQWEAGLRRLDDAYPEQRPALERVTAAIEAELRRRLGGPFTLDELVDLYARGTSWCTDIAYEVAQTHRTTLCGRDCGNIPFRPGSKPARLIFPLIVFAWKHVLTRKTPMGRKMMPHIRNHGAPMLRVKRSDLDRREVQRVEQRVVGVRDGLPELADGSTVDVRSVIWCTGFRQTFDWIQLPILRADGWPDELRGVVPSAPGLYFCGLAFQYAFSSMVLPGVGRDADYLAKHIATRAGSAEFTTTEAQAA